MPQTYRIRGEDVSVPVHIRDAGTFAGLFSVPSRRAQEVIAYSGLEVLPYRPGRTVCALMFVDYRDGDLHRYREFGVGFLVRAHAGGGPAGALGKVRTLLSGAAGVFIHRLPVTEEFTLAAGRTIWGFPKVLSRIDLTRSPSALRGTVRTDGELIADLRVTHGVPVPRAGVSSAIDVYTHTGGMTRRVPWTLRASGTRLRPGGADLLLGTHPWAEELRSLGLPHRALSTMNIEHVRMRFDEAEPVAAQASA